MLAFDRLSLRDLATLCTRVTESTRGSETVEDAASSLVRCLREAFVDVSSGTSDIVLARVFQTAPTESLPPDLDPGTREPAAEAERWLVLLGSDGDLPEWCDRRGAGDVQATLLTGAPEKNASPLVSALVGHLGATSTAGPARPTGTVPADGGPADDDFEVSFVPVAAGSHEVPEQQLVRTHGVASVLAFGGLLPGGDVFSVILYSRKPISEEVAELFRTVAVAAKLAVLPTLGAPLFHGQPGRPADSLALASARMRALEQMLDVQQQTVASQAAHLEDALQEAVASRNRAEREVVTNELLRQVTTMLSAELDVDRLVQQATDAATRITGAAFGAFMYDVVEEDGEEYMHFTLSGIPRSAFERFPMPRPTAIFRPTFDGADILRSDDITQDPRYGLNAPYQGMPPGHPELRSYLAVPVTSRSGEVHGGFFFGHPRTGVFSDREERLVVGIAAQTAIALDNARLYQAERTTALTLQRSLLPQAVRTPEGLEIGYEYLPGGGGIDVGGDWFDVIPLAGGRTAFVIGDVMGRGVRAAAVMGQLRTAIRAYTVGDLPPDVLVDRLNTLVLDMGDDLIATCTYAVLNQTEDTVTFASAGHLPPAVVGTDRDVELLELPAGPPLGVPGAVQVQHTVDLPVGTRMLLFTDGLVEHRGRSLDDGLRTLSGLLRALEGPSDLLCKNLIAALLDEDSQDDDVTLLMVANTGLRRQEYAERTFSPEPRAAATARAFMTEVLAGWDDEDHADQVVMAVNEMFINALAHARTPITVRLRRLPRLIVAEVEDLDAHQPRRSHPDPEDENHRGLHIVEMLASRWGARPNGKGKVVWAEFATEDALATEATGA